MVSRRESLAALAGAPFFGLAARATAALAGPGAGAKPAFDWKSNFRFSGTFMNGAYTHPLPLDAAAAMELVKQERIDPNYDAPRRATKTLFARLINAEPSEIAWAPSTSYGESFVIGALALEGDPKAGIVTDILHFDGSLYSYGELAKQGNPLTILPMTADGRIDMNRLESAVKPGTKLVAVSLVSMVNGFQHDLKTVCDIAHRRGAYVYADIIQAAGAVPIDVKASGVDFAACSSFKWLMGDFGCGFLYVRADLLPKLKRSEFGYHQTQSLAYHAFPGDPPGDVLFESTANDTTAAGRFEVGSVASGPEAAVAVSLQNFLDYGVDRMQRERQPIIDRLSEKLGAHYPQMTPKGSKSPIIAFAMKDARQLRPKLKEAKINIQVYPNRFRVSPSVFNTLDDVDKLVSVLT